MGKALEIPILDESFEKVGSDLSAKQYFLVKRSGDTIALCDDATDLDYIGVLQNKPTQTTEAPSVRTIGVSKVKYGGNVTKGEQLTTDGSGRAITAAPGAGVTHQLVGQARTSGAVDELGSMFVKQGFLQTTD